MKEYTNSDIRHWIDEYVHSKRDRDILIDRFVDGLTFDALETKYDMTERQIKRIVKKADNFFIGSL